MATEESSNGGFAVLITRVAGCWVLVGAFMKLFLGTPQDLPQIVRDLPPDVGLTFKVAISAELAIGFLALLKPRWSWLLVMTLLLVFDVALITQIKSGEPSCGCFGTDVVVPPVVVLVIDSLLILLILVSRPWTALGRDGIHALAMAMLLVVAVPLPWLLDREGGNPVIGDPWVTAEVEKWVGKPFADLRFAKEIDLDGLPTTDGVWLVWVDTCEFCADVLRDAVPVWEQGQRHVFLLQLPRKADEADDQVKVHDLPEDFYIHRIELEPTGKWVLTPPVLWVVRDGCVVYGNADPRPENYHESLDPETPPGCRSDDAASK
jgi:hypothetical protein